jgi:hypothetical protein
MTMVSPAVIALAEDLVDAIGLADFLGARAGTPI